MKGVVALLVVVAAAIPAQLAAADPAPAPAAGLDTEEVVVYDIDRNGKQLGPKVTLSKEEREAHRVRDGAPRSFRARRAPARAANSGCRSVLVTRIHYTLLWNTAYRFTQKKDFCWTYPRVTGSLSSFSISDVDPNFVWRGLVSSWGDFFNWCCGVWNSGHQSFRQGSFENCIFGYGCIGVTYPWVRIYGYGNGNYGYDTGS